MAPSTEQKAAVSPMIKKGDMPRTVWVDDTDWHINAGETFVFLNGNDFDCDIEEWSGKEFPFDFSNKKFKVPGKKQNQGPGAIICQMKSGLSGTYEYGLTNKSMATPNTAPKEVTIP